jgi:thiamine pyrophosphate-dependent acetolactate synthase large subunit-like protein/nitrite reductase/ring-hydroxylating ferredoxin subunit
MSDSPVIADRKPIKVELMKDEEYWFCTCGRSDNQPFCDGSHDGTAFQPMQFRAEQDGPAVLCACKHTSTPPYCDGTHARLADVEAPAAPPANARVEVSPDKHKVWHRVASVDELREGESKVVTAGTIQVALTLRGGGYGAIANECPHQGGPLGEGSFDADGCLSCPWHGWKFNARTGEGVPGTRVQAYPVEIREDGIHVQVEEEAIQRNTVSDVMVRTMVNWGVTHVFGMVGHSNLGLADAIRKVEAAGQLTFIGVRHEGAAAFAASGFAKACGRPAACLTIAGPGATNLLTGIWDARVDRHPLIALTGQVNTQVLGPGAFQELDLLAAFESAVMWSQTVLPQSEHAELMNLALKNALVQRGPTHLVIPDEVQTVEVSKDTPVGSPDGRLGDPSILPSSESVTGAASRLAKAKRPTIIVGFGAKGRMEPIKRLAEQFNAPVLTTFKAKGLIADRHPLAAGVLGRSGTPVAAQTMAESDLLLVFGASFAAHTGIAPQIPIIQVDSDRMMLGKFHPVELPIWGEIEATATAIQQALPDQLSAEDRRPALRTRWAEWRKEKNRRAHKCSPGRVSSAAVFETLSTLAPEDAMIAVDVGNNTYSFGRYFESSGSQLVLMSGYLGSIGFGFPAAMGAWAACPDRPVLCVTGDGGFGQYMGEFTTAVKHGMKILHVLLNNSELGKISKEQRDAHFQVWHTGLHNPNFAEFARLCGGFGRRVTSAEGVRPALQEAMNYDGPALVEVITDPSLV